MAASVQTRLDRIRNEFAIVVADSGRGREFVAAQMVALKQGSEAHDQWSAALPDTVEVVATDDRHSESAFLKLFLLPDRNTLAVFFSEAHSVASASLLARLRSALAEEVDVLPIGTRIARDRKEQNGAGLGVVPGA